MRRLGLDGLRLLSSCALPWHVPGVVVVVVVVGGRGLLSVAESSCHFRGKVLGFSSPHSTTSCSLPASCPASVASESTPHEPPMAPPPKKSAKTVVSSRTAVGAPPVPLKRTRGDPISHDEVVKLVSYLDDQVTDDEVSSELMRSSILLGDFVVVAFYLWTR